MSKKRYGALVYNNDYMALEEVVEIFKGVFGYGEVQATSCAMLVQQAGRYTCLKDNNKEKVNTAVTRLRNHRLVADMVKYEKE